MSTIRRSIIAGALALPMSLGTVGVASAADTNHEHEDDEDGLLGILG